MEEAVSGTWAIVLGAGLATASSIVLFIMTSIKENIEQKKERLERTVKSLFYSREMFKEICITLASLIDSKELDISKALEEVKSINEYNKGMWVETSFMIKLYYKKYYDRWEEILTMWSKVAASVTVPLKSVGLDIQSVKNSFARTEYFFMQVFDQFISDIANNKCPKRRINENTN